MAKIVEMTLLIASAKTRPLQQNLKFGKRNQRFCLPLHGNRGAGTYLSLHPQRIYGRRIVSLSC